ncbi:unnamed protein product [Candidula unifasciata]|uniref:Uncharacterized protein n=1 Tax=Candidula unifasciata TaxID=100452 RepID=A0A8S3Z563_9EUPU|nr:unnamed protein product [Candidula unifasciata]
MQPLRLAVFLAFIVGLRAYALTDSLAEFYCDVNGDYDDREQVEKDGGDRSLIDLKLVPVVAPSLSPLPVLYVVESIAGVLVRVLILIVTQDPKGYIYTDPYNVTGKTDIKSGTFDVNQVKSLTPADLQGQQDCKDVFEPVQPFVFAVNYPDCKETPVNGSRSSYGVTVTCNEFFAIVPAGAPEKPTLVPYQFKRRGNKYQLEDAPSNYVCDCDKPSN